MKPEGKSFHNEEMSSPIYTCDGEDRSSHLAWSEFPEDSKSYALSGIEQKNDFFRSSLFSKG